MEKIENEDLKKIILEMRDEINELKKTNMILQKELLEINENKNLENLKKQKDKKIYNTALTEKFLSKNLIPIDGKNTFPCEVNRDKINYKISDKWGVFNFHILDFISTVLVKNYGKNFYNDKNRIEFYSSKKSNDYQTLKNVCTHISNRDFTNGTLNKLRGISLKIKPSNVKLFFPSWKNLSNSTVINLFKDMSKIKFSLIYKLGAFFNEINGNQNLIQEEVKINDSNIFNFKTEIDLLNKNEKNIILTFDTMLGECFLVNLLLMKQYFLFENFIYDMDWKTQLFVKKFLSPIMGQTRYSLLWFEIKHSTIYSSLSISKDSKLGTYQKIFDDCVEKGLIQRYKVLADGKFKIFNNLNNRLEEHRKFLISDL